MNERTKFDITFTETLSGFIAFDNTEPLEGEKSGKNSGSFYIMRTRVGIDDIDKFIEDPDHKSSLTGTIDFTPAGKEIPISNGRFNIFSPSDDPEMKYMIYDYNFSYNNKMYYFRGKKKVKDDPGFDLWEDTTTLFCHIHEGSDAKGKVVCAGILKISLSDLLKHLPSLQAESAESVKEKGKLIFKFGKFFLGNLWDTYASFTSAKE